MSLTDSEVRGYKAGEKRQTPSCGDALFPVLEPIGKGGGKSFMGVMRFPLCSPKNGGKRDEPFYWFNESTFNSSLDDTYENIRKLFDSATGI